MSERTVEHHSPNTDEDAPVSARNVAHDSPATGLRRLRHRTGELWSSWTASIRPAWLTDELVTGIRWGLVIVWIVAFAHQCYTDGVPLYRSDLLVWLVTLLAAVSIGKRAIFTILLDFFPFAAVLVAYDYVRGFADTLGMPTWWHPQLDVDKFLFFGTEPTVWLQEHLKHSSTQIQWYDVVVTLCYCSFFFLPYVMAVVMWWRSRKDFYRWALRFVALSFIGFGFFALIPAAPPWAAGHCTAADVVNHPSNPACMYGPGLTDNSLLGHYTSYVAGSNPWVERGWSTLGLEKLHLHFARVVIAAGQGGSDAVAAVPSLHLGGTVLFCLFMWSRLRKRWRPVLIAYPLLMTFSLAYSAEHYVADCIAGALLAWAVHSAANWIERRRAAAKTLDTLDTPPPGSTQESLCPSKPGTTPSSTSASDADSSSPPARSMAEPAPHGTTAPSASS